MERLQAALARWRAAVEGVTRPPAPALTEEQRDVLRAVGYVK
jgi:hypothetical protein